MPTEISPRKFQQEVNRGFDRLKNFRSARLMFLRNYVGQYYDQASGSIGTEALNLIFNAIRVLVPTIVMNFPRHRVNSRFVASQEYAELLGMALDYHDRIPSTKIIPTYRSVIVDAIFTLGIIKTGLAASDSVYAFDDQFKINAGEVYSAAVDFDNFIVDSNCKEHMFTDARYMGDRICVSRQELLDSGLYDNSLIEQLPRAGNQTGNRAKEARNLSQSSLSSTDRYGLLDEVEIAELWVPQAQAIVTVPGTKDITFDDYLRVADYEGPDSGPYSLLSLTPPVPGNPLPVPMVGIWNDLHISANRMAKKILDQAERQKDLVAYRRALAEDAEEMQQAMDGEAIATDDPDGVRVISFGGQQQSNEIHLAQLNSWFNMMSGNPQAIGGERFQVDSATEARLLQSNASIGIEDMKDLVYQMAASEGRLRAWYFHTDPLIEIPLIKRQQMPAEFQQGILGPEMTKSPRIEQVQIFLTPEARRGDFIDFTFAIEPESMGRKDSETRFREAIDFAVKILPAALQAAQSAAMLGIPFSPKIFVIKMAQERGIDWMDQVFADPEFQQQMILRMMAGPSPQTSQGIIQPQNPLSAIMQNGQPGQVMSNPSRQTQEAQSEQQGANREQAILKQVGLGV